MAVVSMKDLLEAGVHFGHQTRRWNPKMKPYIFTERNGIYILDLQRTLREIDAHVPLRPRAHRPRRLGPVRRHQEAGAGARSGTRPSAPAMPYVNQRWLGGMLTNFVTIRKRIARMTELETHGGGRHAWRSSPRRKRSSCARELEKLQKNLTGIRDMNDAARRGLRRRHQARGDRRHRGAPPRASRSSASSTPTADPDEVDYVIPGNDDAIRSVGLICRVIADAACRAAAPRSRARRSPASSRSRRRSSRRRESCAPPSR